MTTPDIARQHLTDWHNAQPTNFFSADLNLQRSLELMWGTAEYKQHAARLYKFGGLVATELDAAATRLEHHPPTLHTHNSFGIEQNEVEFHPDYARLGQKLYGSGVTAVYADKGSNLLGAALFYLSSQMGEAGHNCPITCTVGLIKALQNAAAPPIQDQFLPGLLDATRPNPVTGAQFLTEIQGGSDVGANQVFAYMGEADDWYLSGEKWFCSNVTADLALVTARVPGQGDGTKGLGLFLVPRFLPDGSPNGTTIRRLKDKFGTRSLATAELIFHDARAYPIGPTEKGFANVMTHVINTSRLYNALGCAGNARRAYLTAWTYAEHRHAFGSAILHYPLVQEILTQMRSDSVAMLSGTLRLAKLVDDVETGEAKAGTEAVLRLGINLNKFRSALLAHEVINQGIEILGGNGTIEDFSVLPRLLRDNVVYENWEGSHNVLLAQVQRDMRKYRVHEPFIQFIREMLQPSPFDELRRQALAQLSEMEQQIGELLAMDELSASVPLRPLLARLMDLFYTACLAVEGAWEYLRKDDRTKHRLAEFFLNRRVLRRESITIPDYAHQISKLCTDIRPWKIDWDKDRELHEQMGDWAE